MLIAQIEFFHIGTYPGIKTALRIEDGGKKFKALAAQIKDLKCQKRLITQRLQALNAAGSIVARVRMRFLGLRWSALTKKEDELHEAAMRVAQKEIERTLAEGRPIGYERTDRSFREAYEHEREQYLDIARCSYSIWVFVMSGSHLCADGLEGRGYIM